MTVPLQWTGKFFSGMFSRQEDPAALGLTRILVVAVLLVNVAAHLGAVGEYFSDESLIAGRRARFRTAYGRTDAFVPGRGLAQGCPLACLCSIVALDALNRTLAAECRGSLVVPDPRPLFPTSARLPQ